MIASISEYRFGKPLQPTNGERAVQMQVSDKTQTEVKPHARSKHTPNLIIKSTDSLAVLLQTNNKAARLCLYSRFCVIFAETQQQIEYDDSPMHISFRLKTGRLLAFVTSPYPLNPWDGKQKTRPQ